MRQSGMIRAITFGTFDLLYYGHMRFLARMREMLDRVYVGLASDEITVRNKNRQPFYNYGIQREMLLHSR